MRAIKRTTMTAITALDALARYSLTSLLSLLDINRHSHGNQEVNSDVLLRTLYYTRRT